MYRRKSILKHSRSHNRRRKLFVGKAILSFFFLGLLFLVVFYFLNAPVMAITGVKVDGAGYTSATLLESKVKDELQGKYGHLISRANSLFFPRQRIEDDITENFPAVESARVSRSDFHTLSIKITERKPFALWCAGEITAVPGESDKCFFFDKDGFIFTKASDPLPLALLTYSGALSKKDDPIGQRFLTADTLHSLSAFLEFLPALNLKPLFIVAGSSGEIEAHIEGNHKLLLRTGMSYDTALQNLESLFDDASLDWKEKGIPATLEYIDLRFDNKVFYK